MTADLALTLSFEGISLLLRVPDGWHQLGEVGLDSETLENDLAALREQARAHSGEGFRTLLVLPRDQIKCLTLETKGLSQAEIDAFVTASLEAETPYTLDQLAFDLCSVGDKTLVAAVARDTLSEAEAFSVEHAFHPARFTAALSEEEFLGVPDFGPTEVAADLVPDETVMLGTMPLTVLGTAPVPVSEAETAPDAVKEDPPEAVETPIETPEPKSERPAPDHETKSARDEAVDVDETVSFSSIRAQRSAPSDSAPRALSGVTRHKDVEDTPPNERQAQSRHEAPLRFDPAKVVAGLKQDAGPISKPLPRDPQGSADSGVQSRRQPTVNAPKTTQPDVIGTNEPIKPPKKSKRKRAKRDETEKRRMTLFGSREREVRGKPRYLGVVLTTLLILFLAAVAIWASIFTEDGVAGLFGFDDDADVIVLEPVASEPAEPELDVAALPDTPQTPVTTTPMVSPAVQTSAPITAAAYKAGWSPYANSLVQPAAYVVAEHPSAVMPDAIKPDAYEPDTDFVDSAEIEAELDSLRPSVLNQFEAEARYAASGIWQRAPQQPNDLSVGNSNDIYLAAIDEKLEMFDAVALPEEDDLLSDTEARAQLNPVPEGTVFELDARGLVVASANGTLNPSGILVFAGRPSAVPAAYPKRIIVDPAARSEAAEARIALARPKPRPDDLIANSQRAALGGLTFDELGRKRPQPRPESAKDAADVDIASTEFAVTTSVRPRQRPSNMAQLAQRAKPAEVVVATPAAATITPEIPTTASVARQATIKNAINLRKVNLIGVYGTASNRRALVRLTTGRYKKVQVGDRIDGGKVSAISEGELHYTKSGRSIVLKMPKG